MTEPTLTDHFADTPDAEPQIPPRSRRRMEKACDPLGNSGAKKRKTDFSALQRKWFADNGWTFARVEHANAWGAVTVDLWGFGDWLAVRGNETLIVQTCVHGDAAKRETKARSQPELAVWLSGGGRRFVIHGWRQPGGPGTKWEVVEREVTL